MRLTLALVFLLAILHLGDALNCHDDGQVVECEGSCQNITGIKDDEITFQTACWPDKEISRCEETTMTDGLKIITCYCNLDACNEGSIHNIALPILLLSVILYHFV